MRGLALGTPAGPVRRADTAKFLAGGVDRIGGSGSIPSSSSPDGTANAPARRISVSTRGMRLAALELVDLGPMKRGQDGERFLGEPFACPDPTKVGREPRGDLLVPAGQ